MKQVVGYIIIMACLLLGMPNVVWGQTTFTLVEGSIKDSEGVTPDDEDNEFDDSDVFFTITDGKGNEFGFDNYEGGLSFNSFSLTTDKTITELVFPSFEQVEAAVKSLSNKSYWKEITSYDGWTGVGDFEDEDGITLDFDGFTALKKVVIPEDYDNEFYISNLNVENLTATTVFFYGTNENVSIKSLTLTGWGDANNDQDISGVTITNALTLDKVTEAPTIILPEMAGAEFQSLNSNVWLNFAESDPKSIYINGGKVTLTGNGFLKTTPGDSPAVENLESFIVEDFEKFDCSKLDMTDEDGNYLYPDGRLFRKLKEIKINSHVEGVECTLAQAMFDGCYMVETLELDNPGLTYIPDYCFRNYAATEIILPSNLDEVGFNGFGRSFDDFGDMYIASKSIHIAGFASAYQVKYWDKEKNDYQIGFPLTLTRLDQNAFYGHRMEDIHIHKNMKYIGAWALAGANLHSSPNADGKDEYNPIIYTFDEDCERPELLGYQSLWSGVSNHGYEIRIPQKSISHFLHYDETANDKTGTWSGSTLKDGYNIAYAVEGNHVKPYITMKASKTFKNSNDEDVDVIDEEGNKVAKQSFWLPYACKPEKVERMVAKTRTSQGQYNIITKGSDIHYYDVTSFDFDINATLKAYYVGGSFIKKDNEEYDKVVMSRIGAVKNEEGKIVKDEEGKVTVSDNADIIPANIPVMITSTATSVRDGNNNITDEYLVTFNLASTGFSDNGKTIEQKFLKKDKDGKDTEEKLTPTEAKENENWLKAYTTLDGKDFMQPVKALKNSFDDTTDNDHINFVLVSGVFKMLIASGDGEEVLLHAGKAIMSMPSKKYTRTSAGAKGIQMVFANDEDVITGISEHSSSINDNPSSDWYNLQGQRVDRPQHGIFIRNGKKVVVK